MHSLPQVYPRVCGGTSFTFESLINFQGLSPRVRGNRIQGRSYGGDCRSIPACAGEPPGSAYSESSIEVYPRVCGGTQAQESQADREEGLSPRVRGNPAGSPDFSEWPGSIPACAGEPSASLHLLDFVAVYPRVCGGTPSSHSRSMRMSGLSPRVRGNRTRHGLGAVPRRSIPACAGEPCLKAHSVRSQKVYPRVCGGTRGTSNDQSNHHGLSPRVRGNLLPVRSMLVLLRSIPACAGEPVGGRPVYSPIPVYPRVCGGTVGFWIDCRHLFGLSPRVRGNLRQYRLRHLLLRSIPACAGEPSWRKRRYG